MYRQILGKIPPIQWSYRKIKNRQIYSHFKKEFKIFQKMSMKTSQRFKLAWDDIFPQLNDKTTITSFDRHYVYHTAWAARVLAKNKPQIHIDISSSLYFASIVSSFLPIEFYDYRPPKLELSNLSVHSADLNKLPFKEKSISSISCMHVIEHIGLGRYGDPLDPEGDLKAINELKRVTAEGGQILFVVPTGKPKIMFNAHRIYSYDQILQYFSDFKLVEFALIPDNESDGELVYNASKELANMQEYGCGCYLFKRL